MTDAEIEGMVDALCELLSTYNFTGASAAREQYDAARSALIAAFASLRMERDSERVACDAAQDRQSDAERRATAYDARAERAESEVASLRKERDDLAGRFATETKERERCRDGWAECAANAADAQEALRAEVASLRERAEEFRGALDEAVALLSGPLTVLHRVHAQPFFICTCEAEADSDYPTGKPCTCPRPEAKAGCVDDCPACAAKRARDEFVERARALAGERTGGEG